MRVKAKGLRFFKVFIGFLKRCNANSANRQGDFADTVVFDIYDERYHKGSFGIKIDGAFEFQLSISRDSLLSSLLRTEATIR